jgi:hypothetical protein
MPACPAGHSHSRKVQTVNDDLFVGGREITVIALADHLIPDAHRLLTLISWEQANLNALQNELVSLVKVGHNIDISEPGWRINVDAEGRGTLVHIPLTGPRKPISLGSAYPDGEGA